MVSPARRSFERKVAASAGSRAPALPQAGGAANMRTLPRAAATEYELKRADLGEDLRSIKNIQSIEAKIARKADLLPKYDAWVDGILAAAHEAEADGKLIGQDDILVQTMIWAIDCADAVRALPRARAVLRHGMALPTRFERTLGCMIAEEFAEVALKAMATDHTHIADHRLLLEIADLTDTHDMPDQARAKLFKAIGMAIARMADAAEDGTQGPAGGEKAAYDAALKNLNRAFALDSKSGVKKLIEQVTRAAAKQEETLPPD